MVTLCLFKEALKCSPPKHPTNSALAFFSNSIWPFMTVLLPRLVVLPTFHHSVVVCHFSHILRSTARALCWLRNVTTPCSDFVHHPLYSPMWLLVLTLHFYIPVNWNARDNSNKTTDGELVEEGFLPEVAKHRQLAEYFARSEEP